MTFFFLFEKHYLSTSPCLESHVFFVNNTIISNTNELNSNM